MRQASGGARQNARWPATGGRRWWGVVGWLPLLLLPLLVACGGFGTAAVATVNGEAISERELQRALREQMEFLTISQGVNWNEPPAQVALGRLRGQVLEGLIEMRLVRQQAQQQGIIASPGVIDRRIDAIVADYGGREAFLEQLQARDMSALAFRQTVADAVLREQLAERQLPALPATIETRRIRHVLVDSADKAQAARQRLVGGESWEKVAGELSLDPGSRQRGGDLGYIERGLTVWPFDQAAFSLRVDELSQPIATQFGHHILMVIDIRSQPPTPQQVERLRQQTLVDYLQRLRQQATITRQGLEGSQR